MKVSHNIKTGETDFIPKVNIKKSNYFLQVVSHLDFKYRLIGRIS